VQFIIQKDEIDKCDLKSVSFSYNTSRELAYEIKKTFNHLSN